MSARPFTIPSGTIVGEPLARAAGTVRQALQQRGILLDDAAITAATVAAIYGFACSGGLDEAPLADLREIIARRELVER